METGVQELGTALGVKKTSDKIWSTIAKEAYNDLAASDVAVDPHVMPKPDGYGFESRWRYAKGRHLIADFNKSQLSSNGRS